MGKSWRGVYGQCQHSSRKDILEQVGITNVPATYDEVIAAAKAIRAAGIMEHPIVMNKEIWLEC